MSVVHRTPKITRRQILQKYWELACIHADVTKGTLTGQLKALDSLYEHTTASARRNAPVLEQGPGFYESAWKRNGGELHEEAHA